MSDSESRQNKLEKQAEMLRHNLILRKKQIEERERLKEKKSAEKHQNPIKEGK
ncbi:MAG: hypothetical protein ACI4TE_02835 [Alphaproteobacteria bacterium]